MKRIRTAFAVIIICIVLFLLPIQAGVLADAPVSTTGSITIIAEDPDGKAVEGAGFTVMKIADLGSDNGQTCINPTDVFSKYYGDLSPDMTAEENLAAALDLVKYIDENHVTGDVLFTGTEGSMRAEGLREGLYLIRQVVSVAGYQDISPFLVSLPVTSGDGLKAEYDITARPKITGPTDPSDPTAPVVSGTPTNPRNTVTPAITPGSSSYGKHSAVLSRTRLPQTGLLLWPIVVLAVLGLILIIIGWADMNLRRKRK